MTATIIEIALGAIAIALAMFHAKDLKSIALRISTRYLDTFPDYLAEIAELLGRAKKSIVICSDFPAYGRFSNYHAFIDYEAILIKKRAAGVSIDMTCLSRKQRAIAIEHQFRNEFAKKSGVFIRNLTGFLQAYGEAEDEALTIGLARFKELAEKSNSHMLNDTLNGHDYCEVKQPIHIFFWLVDGREAIFSIPSHSEKALEQGFYTCDGRLIEALKLMRHRYQKEHRDQEENNHRH